MGEVPLLEDEEVKAVAKGHGHVAVSLFRGLHHHVGGARIDMYLSSLDLVSVILVIGVDPDLDVSTMADPLQVDLRDPDLAPLDLCLDDETIIVTICHGRYPVSSGHHICLVLEIIFVKGVTNAGMDVHTCDGSTGYRIQVHIIPYRNLQRCHSLSGDPCWYDQHCGQHEAEHYKNAPHLYVCRIRHQQFLHVTSVSTKRYAGFVPQIYKVYL